MSNWAEKSLYTARTSARATLVLLISQSLNRIQF